MKEATVLKRKAMRLKRNSTETYILIFDPLCSILARTSNAAP
jgi:hypothetical protein